MKGLLLKDFYNLRTTLKTMLMILVIFLAFVIIRHYEFALQMEYADGHSADREKRTGAREIRITYAAEYMWYTDRHSSIHSVYFVW